MRPASPIAKTRGRDLALKIPRSRPRRPSIKSLLEKRAAEQDRSFAIFAAIRRASSDVVAIDDGFTEWPSAGPGRLQPGWRDPSRCNAPVHAGDRRRDYAPGHRSE